jgi:hypothetical protein
MSGNEAVPAGPDREVVKVLGKTLTDGVSGFTGMCTGVSQDLSGYVQVELTARSTKGESPATLWVSVARCVLFRGEDAVTFTPRADA